jgi:hypothetical protein
MHDLYVAPSAAQVLLDALGTERIPDSTTAGDSCRRFDETDIRSLMDAIDEARLNVWARQQKEFFDRATIDMDGTLVMTSRTSRHLAQRECPQPSPPGDLETAISPPAGYPRAARLVSASLRAR